MKKICISAIFLMAIGCIMLGAMYQHNGIVEATPEILTPKPDQIVYLEPYELYADDKAIRECTLQKLCESSDLVVVGRVESREPVYKSLITTIEVEKLLKGTCSTRIKVFENAGMNYLSDEDPCFENMFYSYDGYVYMENEKEYVLFLCGNDERAYSFTGQGFGKYPVGQEPDIYIENDNALIKYAEYQHYDVWCPNQAAADVYIENAKQVQTMLEQA